MNFESVKKVIKKFAEKVELKIHKWYCIKILFAFEGENRVTSKILLN